MIKKKFRYVVFFLMAGVFLADCATHKKVEYNIPDRIPESQRAELLAAFERGRKMYEANCSHCHGIFSKGKDGIPDFTDQQIDNYSAWAIRLDKRNHAVTANMSSDQLHEVFMFLRFRKRKSDDKPPAKLPQGKNNS